MRSCSACIRFRGLSISNKIKIEQSSKSNPFINFARPSTKRKIFSSLGVNRTLYNSLPTTLFNLIQPVFVPRSFSPVLAVEIITGLSKSRIFVAHHYASATLRDSFCCSLPESASKNIHLMSVIIDLWQSSWFESTNNGPFTCLNLSGIVLRSAWIFFLLRDARPYRSSSRTKTSYSSKIFLMRVLARL